MPFVSEPVYPALKCPCRVVLNASSLPDPHEVDYDLLLSYVLSPSLAKLLLMTSKPDTLVY
jgi:hypothetical protein